mmetsp:Transcript_25248/g.31044  ORF Transcript_25248/g.31044 Transcript_25248/m.31044 type:complete len:92 (-) Transcript_25248:230-505(-)
MITAVAVLDANENSIENNKSPSNETVATNAQMLLAPCVKWFWRKRDVDTIIVWFPGRIRKKPAKGYFDRLKNEAPLDATSKSHSLTKDDKS